MNTTDKYLNNIIRSNKISHSYLFSGLNENSINDYVLKFVKAIFCENNIDRQFFCCDVCKKCKQINSNNYIDFFVIDSESKVKKEDIINIKKELSLQSSYGKKIYWIKNIDKITIQAANSMLKVLEEPEDDIIAILTTTKINFVLPTILSRCQIINVNDKFSYLDSDLENIEFKKVLNLFINNYKKNKNMSIFTIIENINNKDNTILFLKFLQKKLQFFNKIDDYIKKDFIIIYESLITSLELIEKNVSSNLVLENFIINIIENNINGDNLASIFGESNEK